MTIRMDEGAAELLDTLHRAGYAAYVVGGCVRDSLLGLTPHDWDLCTSALPQQVMELFGAQRCIPTGLQHGTVTVKQGGRLYETTTFRTEGAYSDGRHPDAVCFVPDVREDLARRDFTINAMAYNEKEGLVDPFGGQADLQSGIVRAVGVPRQRFTEDALRILRLYRFAARFGFAIDPPTAQAAQELCAHLDCVSVERIEEELAKLLSAPAPAAYLDKKILLVILPELSSEALAAAKPVVDACPAGEQALPVRLAALLLTLKYHLSKNEELTKRQLLKLFEQSNHKLKTGFVGTPLLNNVLTDNGMNDLAYELLLNEEFPGWLYEVKLGATTVWERWNSLLADGTISGISMNSMNHYAYGSIQEWMFRHVAGINTMESHPGARTVQFAPTLNWDLRYAEAKYDSASGMYSIRWELSDKEHVTITMDVPFDCTAEAVLPMVAKSEKEAVAEVLGSEENGRYLLEPGHYEVSYQLSGWKEKTAVCVE